MDERVIEKHPFSLAQDDFRPVVFADNVKRIDLDHFKFTRVVGGVQPFVSTNVGGLDLGDTGVASPHLP